MSSSDTDPSQASSSAESAPRVVPSSHGLHARPSALLAAAAKQFQSSVKILHKDQSADAKSVVKILGLGVEGGDFVRFSAIGVDAQAAVEALDNLIASGFDEPGHAEKPTAGQGHDFEQRQFYQALEKVWKALETEKSGSSDSQALCAQQNLLVNTALMDQVGEALLKNESAASAWKMAIDTFSLPPSLKDAANAVRQRVLDALSQ